MIKTLTAAAIVAAMSFAAIPATIVVAHAQDATQPPSAPNPSDADKSGGDSAKSDASKGSMSSSKSKKKSKHHHAKKAPM